MLSPSFMATFTSLINLKPDRSPDVSYKSFGATGSKLVEHTPSRLLGAPLAFCGKVLQFAFLLLVSRYLDRNAWFLSPWEAWDDTQPANILNHSQANMTRRTGILKIQSPSHAIQVEPGKELWKNMQLVPAQKSRTTSCFVSAHSNSVPTTSKRSGGAVLQREVLATGGHES